LSSWNAFFSHIVNWKSGKGLAILFAYCGPRAKQRGAALWIRGAGLRERGAALPERGASFRKRGAFYGLLKSAEEV